MRSIYKAKGYSDAWIEKRMHRTAVRDEITDEWKKRENIRDHMTDLDLIFSMLGEATTTEITRTQDAQRFDENSVAARKGGGIAGDAREKLGRETKKKVVSSENYLTEPESRKLREKKKGGN